MSDHPDDPTGGGPDQPFSGLPFFGDIAKLFQGQGPINWDMARQMAQLVATEGQASEPNVDPAQRIALAELGRIAQMRVEAHTGLTVARGGREVEVTAVAPGAWARQTLEDWRPLLERLAEGLSTARAHGDEGGEGGDPTDALLGGLFQMIGPMMLGMQSGMMVGHLASTTLGSYDLPLTRPPRDEVAVVLGHVDAFAADWSIPVDEARLWICIRELTTRAVLSNPTVRDRLEQLVGEHATSFDPDPGALDERLSGLGPALMESGSADPEAMQRALQEALGDPEVLLGAIRTDHQRGLASQIRAIVAAVVGYADWVLDEIGPGLMGSYGALTEALRRRRVEEGPGDRFVGRLLGVELDQDTIDDGSAFIDGIVARGGADALVRLWTDDDGLPTPSEIEAPGLWLARMGVDVALDDDVLEGIDFDDLDPGAFGD